MKKFLRKWLGVVTAREDIKIIVDLAVEIALDNISKEQLVYTQGIIISGGEHRLVGKIRKSIETASEEAAKNAVNEIIDTEELIDQIIDRINRKQIK